MTAMEIQEDWRSLVKEGVSIMSGASLLDRASKEWAALRLLPPDRAEAAAFAAAVRAIKHQKSLAVALPLLGRDTLVRLMVYLQRIRMDTLEGGIRSPWLNPSIVSQRQDVVLLADQHRSISDLGRIPQLRCVPVIASAPEVVCQREGSTLIFDGRTDPIELATLVEQVANPFVIVVDASVASGVPGAELDHVLSDTFPQVPRLILLSMGDHESIEAMRRSHTNTHVWVSRVRDAHELSQESSVPDISLVRIRDKAYGTAMLAVASQLSKLWDVANRAGRHPGLTQRLAILSKVYLTLNSLAFPEEHLELQLKRFTLAGGSSIHSLKQWLHLAADASVDRDVDEGKSHVLIHELMGIVEAVSDDQTGKAMWLESVLQESVAAREKVLVLCATQPEVIAAENWLDEQMDLEWSNHITFWSMDDARVSFGATGMPSKVIILGPLTKPRQHWLSTTVAKLMIPVYEHEADQVRAVVTEWWKEYGALSETGGDKFRLWTMDWHQKILDRNTEGDAPDIVENTYQADSRFSRRPGFVSIPIELNAGDWMQRFLSDPVEPAPKSLKSEASHPDIAWVQLEEYASPLPWPKNRTVFTLDGEDLKTQTPEALKQGDKVVLLKRTPERLATQERLFELMTGDKDLQIIVRFAERWQSLVDHAASRMTPRDVLSHLAKEGVTLTAPAVNHWFNHSVYGPRDSGSVVAMCKLGGIHNPLKSAGFIERAIQEVRGIHRSIGTQLRKAILQRAAGAKLINLGPLLLDGRAFDDMVELCTVKTVTVVTESVQLPLLDAIKEYSITASLSEIASIVQSEHPGRLVFTPAAERSMRACEFKDIDRFHECLVLMATTLHDHYNYKLSRFSDALEPFKELSISFAPKMSASTMGQFRDDRQYKGRAADLNKHFCLGNSRDVTRLLRIHYEWDDAEQVIVIHHAGAHLKTRQS